LLDIRFISMHDQVADDLTKALSARKVSTQSLLDYVVIEGDY
jgi:hypothetical protein